MNAHPEFWAREKAAVPSEAVERSATFLAGLCAEYQPTHIVSLVSGGLDSAAAHEVAALAGVKVDLVLHIRTGTGIRQTGEFVEGHYGAKGPDFAVGDAGTAYERYVDRKGFFGVGRSAHNMAYHVLKADPLRAAISRLIRKRQRGVRVMLLNGARASESANRSLNLKRTRLDKGNLWANTIHDWTSGERDQLLDAAEVEINPVATQLCRSGECMCGTMQARGERLEAAALYPEWGAWLDDLERRARRKHGFGWGETIPEAIDPDQGDLFNPMCAGCNRRAEQVAA